MKILSNTLAIFWSRKGWGHFAFQADWDLSHGETPQQAVQRFRELFPEDTVHSVRDRTGRFVAFKQNA